MSDEATGNDVWQNILDAYVRIRDTPWPTHPDPHPTKLAVLSAEDVPVVRGPAPLFSVPAVIQIDGVWMRFRVSEFVPAGQAFVLDTAYLDVADAD